MDLDFDDDIFDELADEIELDDDVVSKRPLKRNVIEDEDDDEDNEPVKKAKASPKKSSSPKKPVEEVSSTEAVETPKKKFNYYAYLAKKSAGPIAPGSKEIPEGSPGCLEVGQFSGLIPVYY